MYAREERSADLAAAYVGLTPAFSGRHLALLGAASEAAR
jgi:hypothetical protein